MNSKILIVGILALLLLGVGIFLWQQNQKENQYSATPTTWSQAGDYEIKEVAGQQTVVTNKKAGFSFRVPKAWGIEDEGDGIEYSLNLLSPEVKFDEDNFLLEGCFVHIETITQKTSVTNLSALVRSIREAPNSYPEQQVIVVERHDGIQTLLTPKVITEDPDVLKRVRDVIRTEIPIDEETLVDFELVTKKNVRDQCFTSFEKFLSEVSFQ